MKQEKSAGGVVYRRSDGKFLIGKHSGYHKWVLPKGLVERGESQMEAAVREVEEEVGVEARIVEMSPIKTIEYWYFADLDTSGKTSRRVAKYAEDGGAKVRVHKQVIFYLMEMERECPPKADQPLVEEMEERKWVTYEEGMKLLAFESERGVLEQAGKSLGL